MMEAPGPINFTMFLTMFGEKLNGTDPEDVIRNAFACFDEEGTGREAVDLATFQIPPPKKQINYSHLTIPKQAKEKKANSFVFLLSQVSSMKITSESCSRRWGTGLQTRKWTSFSGRRPSTRRATSTTSSSHAS